MVNGSWRRVMAIIVVAGAGLAGCTTVSRRTITTARGTRVTYVHHVNRLTWQSWTDYYVETPDGIVRTNQWKNGEWRSW